jgi:hypothetical protein
MKKSDNYLKELESVMYDSFEMQDPRGKLLFLCDKKKIRWYLKKDLAEHIDGKVYRLKIEPKGPGNTNPFFLERLPNQCVVCGAKDHLSKHHVVPHQYRKVFPESYKSSNHFDVLCVCLDCHEKYEVIASEFKEQLHKQHSSKFKHNNNIVNKENCAINAILENLKNKKDTLSEEVINVLLEKLQKFIGRDIPLEEALAMPMRELVKDTFYANRDASFIENYLAKGNTYESFILTWRQHFIDTMKPQFLSKNWVDHYKTFFRKDWRA